ncbi:BTB/POZ and TAZ domain-containing protein 1-like protein [Carex littledalei]|uniref:BTB/POZ and TAZ domain-containing protein 1-like protein n=1 Tax=Carex littledalei TaxID=544730 RepID=A0A833R9P1_9POAL|nr:BTB/POZ and TAZ domain-containing protein 1-like protein [Carex littledalei]
MVTDINDTSCDVVQIVTSSGRRITANSSLLASASLVLERMLQLEKQKQRRNEESKKITGIKIRILGVPHEAVVAFVRSLQSRSMIEEDVEKYGMHLLVLSHVYQASWLKRTCEMMLANLLTTETILDVLQLSRLCDAQRLHLRCLKFIIKDFAAVQDTDAWRFMQENDPWLELDILQFMDETDLKRKRQRRRRATRQVYLELNEVMDCLGHICEEGCTEVGPMDRAPAHSPCDKFETCRGIQLLIRHFASCHKKSCMRCRRMWQLLRLHSALCDQTASCKVPLCMQFKVKAEQMQEKSEAGKWDLLVSKMKVVKVMSLLVKKMKEGGEHSMSLKL